MSSPLVTSTVTDRRQALAPGLEQAIVCVLGGGTSDEREVSLSSAERIAAALRDPADAEDTRGPRAVREVELAPDGAWVVGGRRLRPGAALESLLDVDLFFLALHGGDGEDGTIQGLLSATGRPFTGSGVAASAVAMDKVFSRRVLTSAGLTLARATSITRADLEAGSALIEHAFSAEAPAGFVLKPRGGGSSVGVTIVRDRAELEPALLHSLEVWQELLVEEWIEGVEVTGAVLDTPDRGLEALPVVEIQPKPGRFFDYEEKYSEAGAAELCPPVSIDENVQARVRELSRRAHVELGCTGYSRSDFIAPRTGGEPVFLELNTLPGMTPRSLLPRAARVAGIDYRTLCLWIAAEGLGRGARAESPCRAELPRPC